MSNPRDVRCFRLLSEYRKVFLKRKERVNRMAIRVRVREILRWSSGEGDGTLMVSSVSMASHSHSRREMCVPLYQDVKAEGEEKEKWHCEEGKGVSVFNLRSSLTRVRDAPRSVAT